MEVEVGEKYGCLEVKDDGTEFVGLIESKILDIETEKSDFMLMVEKNKLTHDDWCGWNGEHEVITPAYVYEPLNFKVFSKSIRVVDFDEAIEALHKKKAIQRYKCRCKKCGKIRYYSINTLQTNPQFCLRPMYCSSKSTNSVKASNATYRKRQKYKDDKSVVLVDKKGDVIPSEEYCDKWNEKRDKELKKQAEKDAAIIADIPRKLAKNYNINYVGITYESLDVKECISESLESTPLPHYNQRHQKSYSDITVFKQYRCQCYLCGKDHIVNCDKFGIYPPTQYGYRAYNGYWSDVYCDCHPISSFQWIVNKLLIENDIPYRVEHSFEDLYGVAKIKHLSYDFAIFDKDRKLKCLIECQGEQHYQAVEEFGGEGQFEKQKANDELKKQYAIDHNIELLEISYKDKKYDDIEKILIENRILKP
ncbi:hypothetical protein [Anaerosacchariphilus polymeriproducens]|uniref:DUF2726 domain-containing protein n=1 Tax=Anaerosacchariphilus polymeriproducens TaxID=1812858 RepID=A0A371AQV9_9FIRM|nr:hypothetical protein [Anaerosacchariphilus polymeriproducens]RDU21914.1 hypothetical protein DWV06_18205 [Anaerosacchariphilus polymeriproducens]